jgi:hypothetical protein
MKAIVEMPARETRCARGAVHRMALAFALMLGGGFALASGPEYICDDPHRPSPSPCHTALACIREQQAMRPEIHSRLQHAESHLSRTKQSLRKLSPKRISLKVVDARVRDGKLIFSAKTRENADPPGIFEKGELVFERPLLARFWDAADRSAHASNLMILQKDVSIELEAGLAQFEVWSTELERRSRTPLERAEAEVVRALGIRALTAAQLDLIDLREANYLKVIHSRCTGLTSKQQSTSGRAH